MSKREVWPILIGALAFAWGCDSPAGKTASSQSATTGGYVDISPVPNPIPRLLSHNDLVPLMRNLPATLDEWIARQAQIGNVLQGILGVLPDRFPRPQVIVTMSRHEDGGGGYTLERFEFHNLADAIVPGFLLIPDHRTGPAPLILYIHYHGGEFDVGKRELFIAGWPEGVRAGHPIGAKLVAEGYAVMCIDGYGFNERQGRGPNGPGETGQAELDTFDRVYHARGRTLLGMDVRDNQMALDWVLDRPEIDPNHVATMGMSRGGGMSRWVAAMDPRISAPISIATLEVQHFGILAAIAPRPLLTMNGDADPLNAPVYDPAWQSAIADLKGIYDLSGNRQNYKNLIFPGVTHTFTIGEWGHAMAFLSLEHLGIARAPSCVALGSGLFCGDELLNGDVDTLYRCTQGSISVEQVCANGCQVNPWTIDDACF